MYYGQLENRELIKVLQITRNSVKYEVNMEIANNPIK